jgi:hypothetical protein
MLRPKPAEIFGRIFHAPAANDVGVVPATMVGGVGRL